MTREKERLKPSECLIAHDMVVVIKRVVVVVMMMMMMMMTGGGEASPPAFLSIPRSVYTFMSSPAHHCLPLVPRCAVIMLMSALSVFSESSITQVFLD